MTTRHSRFPSLRAPAGALLLLGTILAAAELRAEGTQTGILTGRVADADGEPLPGVAVTADGPRGSRRTASDDAGRFRFPASSPGVWTVSAELFGLSAGPRETVVYVGKTTDLDLELGARADSGAAEQPVENWIQVVAQAPLVDPWDSGAGANLTRDFLDDLPVERFYQSFALLLPGVAGGEDGNPNVSGALRSANLSLVDGVDTTDPTTGLFGLNLAYEAIQEVEVTTAALPVDLGRVSGGAINVVTRSGTDRWRGQARWLAANNDWNADRRPEDAQRFGHLQELIQVANRGPDRVDSIFSASLGGPLVPDRLWAFAAWEDSASSFLHPTEQGPLWNEDNRVESLVFKLSAQLGEHQSLELQHASDDATALAFAPFDAGPSENRLPQLPDVELSDTMFSPIPGDLFALQERRQEGSFERLGWDAVVSSNLSLRLQLAQQERRLERAAPNRRGLTADAPHVAVLSARPGDLVVDRFVLYNGVTEEGFEERPRDQANLGGEWFLAGDRVDHELSFGVDLQRTDSRTAFRVPGVAGFDPRIGAEIDGQVFLDFDLRDECLLLRECIPFDPGSGTFQPFILLGFLPRSPVETREESWGVHLSDVVSLDRWTFHLGVRVDGVDAESGDGALVTDDVDVSPRIAATWSPTADGEILLSASWSRYHEPFLHQAFDAIARLQPLSGFVEYSWTFEEPFCFFEADPADPFSPCWRPRGLVPPFPIQLGEPAAALERTSVDELTLGFERQLTRNTAVSLHLIDREWDDLWDGVFTVDPATGDPVASIRNVPEARREYKGVHLLVQRRFAGSWQLLGSYTWSESKGNLFRADGLGTFADFADFTDENVVNRFGFAPYDRTHQLGVWATWRRPLGPTVLTLGSALRYRDGVPIERRETLPDGTGQRFLTPRGSERLSGVFQWDLSLGLDVPVPGDLELESRLEVFNLTDEQTQTGAFSENRFFGAARDLGDLQAPRSFRWLLGLRF